MGRYFYHALRFENIFYMIYELSDPSFRLEGVEVPQVIRDELCTERERLRCCSIGYGRDPKSS